ncbi:MAG: VOC family protein [Gammaproteobacteria bacterium]
MTDALFHLAFPVTDLAVTKTFYRDVLGCDLGAEDARWIDINFYGHQITAHLVDTLDAVPTNPVDGDQVPARHFGAILSLAEWDALAARLTQHGTKFLIEPHRRFAGHPREQATMFFVDPTGNYLEFKAFVDQAQIFQSNA